MVEPVSWRVSTTFARMGLMENILSFFSVQAFKPKAIICLSVQGIVVVEISECFSLNVHAFLWIIGQDTMLQIVEKKNMAWCLFMETIPTPKLDIFAIPSKYICQGVLSCIRNTSSFDKSSVTDCSVLAGPMWIPWQYYEKNLGINLLERGWLAPCLVTA